MQADIVPYMQNSSVIAPDLPHIPMASVPLPRTCATLRVTFILIAIFLSGLLIGYIFVRLVTMPAGGQKSGSTFSTSLPGVRNHGHYLMQCLVGN